MTGRPFDVGTPVVFDADQPHALPSRVVGVVVESHLTRESDVWRTVELTVPATGRPMRTEVRACELSRSHHLIPTTA